MTRLFLYHQIGDLINACFGRGCVSRIRCTRYVYFDHVGGGIAAIIIVAMLAARMLAARMLAAAVVALGAAIVVMARAYGDAHLVGAGIVKRRHIIVHKVPFAVHIAGFAEVVMLRLLADLGRFPRAYRTQVELVRLVHIHGGVNGLHRVRAFVMLVARSNKKTACDQHRK